MVERMDEFQKLKQFQTSSIFDDDEFRAMSPEHLRSFFDKEDNERIKVDSFSLMDETSTIQSTSKKDDYSMGAYFQTRSSLPYNYKNVTLLDPSPHDPPEQDKGVSLAKIATNGKIARDAAMETSTPFKVMGKTNADSLALASRQPKSFPFPRDGTSREHLESFGSSMEDPNRSISQLAQFFSDPERSPLSSTAIMDHVFLYCRNRTDTDGRKSKAFVDEIEEKRRRKSDTCENLNVLSKRLSEGHKRDSMSYSAFRQDAADRLFPSRCSTPENVSPTFHKSTASSATAPVSKPFASTSTNTSVRRMPTIESRRACVVPPAQHNRENVNPQPNPMVQVQLNLPTSAGPAMPMQAPIVISFMCPNAPNPPVNNSKASAIEPGRSSTCTLDGSKSAGSSVLPQRQPNDGSSQSKIHIQLSGTIQWS